MRTERFGPRTLDVDLLVYDDLRLDDPDLTLPHPRMWERGFVLAPLRDVAPDGPFAHPPCRIVAMVRRRIPTISVRIEPGLVLFLD